MPLRIGVVADTIDRFKQHFSDLTDEQCCELPPQTQVDATLDALGELGYEVDFIGSIFQLVERLTRIIPGQRAPWELVFNAAEGMFGSSREAQVPALLEAYRIPYTFADALTSTVCLDKGLTKLKLVSYGIPTTAFFVVPPRHQLQHFHYTAQDGGVQFRYRGQESAFSTFPLFIKPNAEGSSKGVGVKSKIHSMDQLGPAIEHLSQQYPEQELLIEPYLCGMECTVGILGTGNSARVLGTVENIYNTTAIPTQAGDTLQNTKSIGTISEQAVSGFLTWKDKAGLQGPFMVKHIDSALVADTEVIALQAHIVLGLRDASRIDIRYDRLGPGRKPYLMEVNTIPGLKPNISCMTRLAANHGMSFTELVGEIVESAKKRIVV